MSEHIRGAELDLNIEYDRQFARGFLLASAALSNPLLTGWSVLSIGQYSLYSHPLTEVASAAGADGTQQVVIIGRPVDLNGAQPGAQPVAAEAYDRLRRYGRQAVLRYIAYLGGRFVAFVMDGAALQVIPDCHATYACYYHQPDATRFFASSHSNLLGQLFGLEPSQQAQWLMSHPDYVSPGGKYYPALLTPYSGVSILFPNCHLTREWSKACQHTRFYPFNDERNVDVEKELALERFVAMFEGHVRRIVGDRSVGVSLTGGWDSRVALGALSRVSPLKRHFGFTYYKPESGSAMSGDLFAASRLAFEVGLPHRVVHLQPVDYGAKFHKMYEQSFRYGARHPALARAYYEQLPQDFCSLISTCSETATVFYRERSNKAITPAVLASKFSTSAIKDNPILHTLFEAYCEYADFSIDRLGVLDFYDVFYWEHRNAKWGSLWYAEADLAHFTVVPFNQRDIIETMLSLSLNLRASKWMLEQYLLRVLGDVHKDLELRRVLHEWK